ncbi:hypothetical protein BK004_02570 [bacterium CG10_46_32]|nr:MAG: hypothetical protein BK004_02570 [bacterium CG10_46_32]PIR56085.1 MAG: hypothetical protein COU73_02595 [Parcubacteria group bacterium CG10_big_fil_rev_8_21_14_0_10_46_32]
MAQKQFAGAKKHATSLLWNVEQYFIRSITPHAPQFLGTRRLTMCTLLWSALVLYFSWRAQENILWLWGASGMLLAQYLTDILDGAVGRHRNEGFVRWGFYMDHVLDFVLAISVFIGYSFLVGSSYVVVLFIFFAIFAIIPASMFLSFSGYNAFKIGSLGFGPTEYRLIIIFLNAAIIYFGVSAFETVLPYLIVLLALYVCILVYQTQKDMSNMDIVAKR